MKIRRIIMLFLISMIFVGGCSLQNNPKPLATGKYEAKIVETEQFLKPWVVLEKDNKFVLNRGPGLSYRPEGTYSIEKDVLVLTSNVNEVYKFKILDDNLIFETGELAEPFIVKGTVFGLQK